MKKTAKISDKSLKSLLYPDGRQKDIYRKISFPLAKLVIRTGISADQIQLIRLVFCVMGAFLFFTQRQQLFILGAVLFQLNILFDTFDGAVARYQKKASVKGEYQDVALDHLTSSVLYFISAAGMAYSIFADSKYLFIGLITAALAQAAAFLRAMYIEYGIPVVESQRKNLLIGIAHQDNSRPIAFMLLLAAALYPFASPIWLSWALLGLVIAKIIILSCHILITARKNPFSIWVMSRYAVVVATIFLWLLEKILGAKTSLARKKLFASKKKSIIEKIILSRLS